MVQVLYTITQITVTYYIHFHSVKLFPATFLLTTGCQRRSSELIKQYTKRQIYDILHSTLTGGFLSQKLNLVLSLCLGFSSSSSFCFCVFCVFCVSSVNQCLSLLVFLSLKQSPQLQAPLMKHTIKNKYHITAKSNVCPKTTIFPD